MVRLIPAICPQCGARLQLPEDVKKAYCTYCGMQVVIDREVKTEASLPCSQCDGTGRCLPHKDSFGTMVYTCYGTGRCPACAGAGKITDLLCGLCKGNGKCWSCEGTGKCSRCNGSGRTVV